MNIFKYEKGIKRASLRKGKMQEGQERKEERMERRRHRISYIS